MQNITFEENKTPKSQHFNDIYYNVDGGLEEKTYVFIQANKLPLRSTFYSFFNLFRLNFVQKNKRNLVLRKWLSWQRSKSLLYLLFLQLR